MDEKCKIACAKVMNVRSKIEFVKMDTKDGWTTQSYEKLLAFDHSFPFSNITLRHFIFTFLPFSKYICGIQTRMV